MASELITLKASFDGGDLSSGSSVRPYYVPHACAQCHGGSPATPKLSLLDSDHWFDRVQEGDDFADVGKAGAPVLFEGGTSMTSQEFAEAVATLRTLNREIRDQISQGGVESFQLRAADHWLSLHATQLAFLPPVSRALPAPAENPNARVRADTPADRELLTRLNRYCYRCHSSVPYHVFDKEAVFVRRNNMIRRIERAGNLPGHMPQDRVLDPNTVTDLVTRLRQLK